MKLLIKSRPSTYRFENEEELVPFTSNMFLAKNSYPNVTVIDEVDAKKITKCCDAHLNSWKNCECTFEQNISINLFKRALGNHTVTRFEADWSFDHWGQCIKMLQLATCKNCGSNNWKIRKN